MYICLCLGVTTSTVQQAIDAGARSTKQVAEACGAGSVCGRCGHEWPPKGEGEPKFCPACKSPYWNKARQQKGSKGKARAAKATA